MDINENVKEYLPLTEATYYILISLIKPLHGYGIMQNVEDISKGEVTLGPGTLYGALNKLEKKGLIMKAENTEDSRRKNYVITEFGKLVIIEEYKRLNELIKCSKNIIKSIGG